MQESNPLELEQKKRELQRILKELAGKNFYDRLGLDVTASKSAIKKAFKEKSREFHPDNKPAELRDIFDKIQRLIGEAYNTLSNPISKMNYDLDLKYPKRSASSSGTTGTRGQESDPFQEAERRRQQAAQEKERELREKQETELGPKIASVKNLDELLEILKTVDNIYLSTGKKVSGVYIALMISIARDWQSRGLNMSRKDLEKDLIKRGVPDKFGILDKAVEFIFAEWEQKSKSRGAQKKESAEPEKPAQEDVPPQTTPKETEVEEKTVQQWNYLQEDVEGFVAEFNLEPLLPEEFKNLNEAQKFKVIRDLERRIVDIVKSNARTQYSEDLKQRTKAAQIRASLNKESELKDFETKAFGNLRNSPEGRTLIAENLEILVKRVGEQKIGLDDKGNPCVFYLDIPAPATMDEQSMIEQSAVGVFNAAASQFANLPYEWGQEKSGKHKKEYEKAKAIYEEERAKVLEIKYKKATREKISISLKEMLEERRRALLEILEVDNAVQMEQLLNTHPEFEKALEDFTRSVDGKAQIKDVGHFLQTMTGGKNLTNKLLFAGGFGARMGVRAVFAASSMTILGALGTSLVGGAIGYWRGKIRGKETLEERQKEARHGKEDKSKEAQNVVKAENLNERMATMIQALENASTPEEKAKRLDQIKRRIDYTQEKIENGLVNFGDAKTSLNNQFNLINNLNNALVISSSLEETTRKNIDYRLNRFLSYRTDTIGEMQDAFIKKQALKGAIFGAGFATLGYTARWLGEHFGLLGHHGAENTSTTNTTPGTSHFSPEPTTVSAPSSVVNNFHGESITFSHGKGGIQGILDLKNQMRLQYHNDFSKAPQSVQDFMNETNVIKQAIKLGLYDPNSPNESAFIQEGSVLKFDEQGNLLFGKPDASGKIPILEKYSGKMFDSDNSGVIRHEIPQSPTSEPSPSTILEPSAPEETHRLDLDEPKTDSTSTPEPEVTPESTPSPQLDTVLDEEVEELKKLTEELKKQYPELAPKSNTEEELRERIERLYDTASKPEKSVDADQIVHGSGHERAHGGRGKAYGTNMGNAYGTNRLGHRGPVYVYDGSEKNLPWWRWFSGGTLRHDVPGFSEEQNAFLDHHPEFAENPFHLSEERMAQVYKAYKISQENIDIRLQNTVEWSPNDWGKIGNLKASSIMDNNEISYKTPSLLRFQTYLRYLKQYSGLEPKHGFLGAGAEKAEHYNIRALQKIAAEGRLDRFMNYVKDSP